MRFHSITVDNFRSIHHAELPLSSFVCAVGHNNAGKSSTLMALSLLVHGTKLTPTDFYDRNRDIVIKVVLAGVTDKALSVLDKEAKDRIGALVKEGTLTLVRRFDTTGKGALRCIRKVPLDERFHDDNVDLLVAGKKGAVLRAAVIEAFPELEASTKAAKTQGDFRVAIEKLAATLTKYIREQFQDVTLDIQIPPPDIRTIFNSAKIFINDGVTGEIETKGDGLKRAVLFSLLRTFVDLRNKRKKAKPEAEETPRRRYLFLFEEPELYLHPTAQRILYDALVDISADHQVCVCTHSPFFFSANGSGTFLRLKKVPHAEVERPPMTSTMPVDLLTDMSKKDAFQIICYENNSAAFFCDRVVLVEGDCDMIYLKHVARLLDPRWNFDRHNVGMIRIGGKGSFARYRKFYESFNVDVRIIADLDAIVDQYQKLEAPASCNPLREKLLQATDELLRKAGQLQELNSDKMKSLAGKQTFKDRYVRCREIATRVAAGEAIKPEDAEDFGKLFEEEWNVHRQRAIATEESLAELKENLIVELRNHGITVLSRGCIEDYYPAEYERGDKPTMALSACSKLKAAEDALKCCPTLLGPSKVRLPEFQLIFDNIFGGL